eukprot:scaffold705_cov402-Prasinococcus_capsulatus_cf.AAC.23
MAFKPSASPANISTLFRLVLTKKLCSPTSYLLNEAQPEPPRPRLPVTGPIGKTSPYARACVLAQTLAQCGVCLQEHGVAKVGKLHVLNSSRGPPFELGTPWQLFVHEEARESLGCPPHRLYYQQDLQLRSLYFRWSAPLRHKRDTCLRECAQTPTPRVAAVVTLSPACPVAAPADTPPTARDSPPAMR